MSKRCISNCFAVQYNQFFRGRDTLPGFLAIEYHSLEDIERYANNYKADRLLHLSGFLDKTAKRKYWNKKFLKKLAPLDIKLLSFDCGPCADDVAIRNGVFVPVSRILSQEEIEKRFSRNINLIRRYYHGPMAIENLNYYPSGAYEYVCRPEIIKRLAQMNDVFILLDIGHLLISAFFLKMHPQAYFNALPKERIIQIHLSRPIRKNGYLIDKHYLPLRQHEELLKEMLKSISPTYLTVEYHRDKERLLKTYHRLSRVFN